MFIVLTLALLATADAASRTCHGDLNSLHPKGQSNGGVAASNRDAQHDLPYLEKHRSCYQQAADHNCIQASVIAALASRESRGGSLLESTGGYGDPGAAWGILQCDIRHSGLNCKSCDWDSCCHINMMVRDLLVPYINQVHRKHPSWTSAQTLQGGVAAYNFGVSNVQSWDRLDIGSTHNDYSGDVIARAQYLYKHGWN
ncbi:glycine, glutamate and proline-rich protein [Aplysia californica]|uniref:Glycine, glutamate and proline-rich protein n=1 Tax=Aplysia californica TaxID=6500 RepID=A0ABM1AF42_APLCA|nr:glycine, glutamate and proline-rich protein [Aplysia californica]